MQYSSVSGLEFDLLSLEQFSLLFIREDHVFGDELVVRDIDEQLFLHKDFKEEGGVVVH